MIARRYAAALAAGFVLSAGCTSSSALRQTADSYYHEGPEQSLKVLDRGPIRDEDLMLASLERAVAFQELGRYQESTDSLRIAERELERTGADPRGLLVNDEAGKYRGEFFERVWIHTVALANLLALQEVEAAAAEANRALERIDEIRCGECRFPFTRYLAAVAFEAIGEPQRAADAIAAAAAESPQIGLLGRERKRMTELAAAGSLEGFAPPPDPGRVLYVLLLLGRGPLKVESAVPVPPSHTVAWPRYLPREPQVVVAAQVELGGVEQRSIALTDLIRLARDSLRARKAVLIPTEAAKTAAQEAAAQGIGHEVGWGAELLARLGFSAADRADLRHWSTLPATAQVLRLRLPKGVGDCELAYTSASGTKVDRETLVLPESWTEGPLFVTRRMP